MVKIRMGNARSHGYLVEVVRSWRPGKKLAAIFSDGTVRHFGQEGAHDFIKWTRERGPSFAAQRREKYLARHSREFELWRDPTRPAALARWLLWEKSTLPSAVRAFRRRFRV